MSPDREGVAPWVRSRLGWLIASLCLVAAGCVVLYLAVVWRWVDCHAEAQSPCSSSSRYQLYAAIAGLAMGGITVVESARRGRPVLWFVLASAAYAIWGYLIDRTFHG